MKLSRTARLAVLVATALVALVAVTAVQERDQRQTEAQIAAEQARVAALARRSPAPTPDEAGWQALPAPVQRYLRQAVRGPVPAYRLVRLSLAGEHRRPGRDAFGPASAEQISAAAVPALAWSATLPRALPGLSTRLHGVLAEGGAPDDAALRRWLMHTPLHPLALLPGGPVRWEAVDAGHARAVLDWQGRRVSLLASIDANGTLTAWQAEAASAGEDETAHMAFADHRLIDYQMLPMALTASRLVAGRVQPLWQATVEDIAFE